MVDGVPIPRGAGEVSDWLAIMTDHWRDAARGPDPAARVATVCGRDARLESTGAFIQACVG